MSLLEEHLRAVDPVDRDGPAADGEALLREIVRTPVPRRGGRTRRRARGRVAVAVAVASAATGLVLAMPGRDDADVDIVAAAFAAVSQPDTILHFRIEHSIRHSTIAARPGELQRMHTTEVWQTGDGSRWRSITRLDESQRGGPREYGWFERAPAEAGRPLETETVQTADESRTWVGLQNRVVVYDTKVPKLPAPGGPEFGAADLGDPRTLLQRARSGDARVVELGEATVRGIPVLQFRVGECRMTPHEDGGVIVRLPVVASVARDGYTPVRLEQDNRCGDAPRPEGGLPWRELSRDVADYVAFETLPATDANRRLLEMRPHPGARVVDGEDVDAAEERSERRGEHSRQRPPRRAYRGAAFRSPS
jgi:hypothetical protein